MSDGDRDEAFDEEELAEGFDDEREFKFDEPPEGLDEATAASLIDSIADHYRDGAVIVISHRGEDLRRATRRVTMLEGELRDDHRRFERSRREVM